MKLPLTKKKKTDPETAHDLEAFALAQQEAQQGDAAAQFRLGWMHANGRGTAQNDRRAVEWYSKAAEQGYAAAQCNLGWMYGQGRGVEIDDEQAAYWFERAATQGDKQAQFNLGNLYIAGQGVPQDERRAAFWFVQAAQQGYAKAQCNLAMMYERGRGVAQDAEQAAEWYGCAAEQGDSKAQYRLGLLYDKGIGVAQDDNMARYWLAVAAEQGNDSAAEYLIHLAEKVLTDWYHQTAGISPLAEPATGHYYDMTFDGDLDYYPLGIQHREGWELLDDYHQSLVWIERHPAPEPPVTNEPVTRTTDLWIDPIADENDNDAWYYPDLTCRENHGLQQDDAGYRRAVNHFTYAAQQAAASFEQAAKQGNADAQYQLGFMYETGQGVEQDYRRAAQWYEKAAAQGHAQAQYQLGCLYREGLGVEENDEEAEKWWQRAAAQGVAQAHRQLEKWQRAHDQAQSEVF